MSIRNLMILVVVACSFALSGYNKMEPADNDCHVIVEKYFNKNCTSNFFMKWKNICTENMDFKYAFERTDGKVMILSSYNTKPGNTFYGSTCFGTGNYKIWSRTSASRSTVSFPTDEEIKKLSW